MGHWFRPAGRRGDGAESGVVLGEDRGGLVMSEPPPGAASKFRLARSGSTMERIGEDHARVVQLVESVQVHLEQQGERAELMARSLARLAESLQHLPDASKTQLEAMMSIGQRLEADGASVRRVEENLSQLPRIADAQRETMVSIGRQLDLSRQTTEKVATTMDGFQEAVTQLGDATTASSKALQEIRWDATAREERMAAILQEQTRRLTIFAIAAVGLAILAAIIGVIALIRG
jgi:hypothetical protein